MFRKVPNLAVMAHKVGDIITLEAPKHSMFYPGIDIEVLEVDDEGDILKARAVNKHPIMLTSGWYEEGDDYVIFRYRWSEN